VLSRGEYP